MSSLDGFSCSRILALKDLYLGLYLTDSTQKKVFFDCYNSQYKKERNDVDFKGFKIKLTGSKKVKAFSDEITKNDRSSELIAILDTMLKSKYDIEKAYKTTLKLNRFSNIMAKLANVYLYKISGNLSKAESIIKEILSREVIYHTLESDISLMSDADQVKYTITLLEKIKAEMESRFVDILIFYLFTQTDGELKNQLNASFSINSTMNYVRLNYNSYTYGLTLPFVWGTRIYTEGSQVELVKYLEKVGILNSQAPLKTSQMLFFRKIKGIDKDSKNKVINKVEKMKISSEFYDQFVYLRLLDDDDFYRYLAANMKLNLGLIGNTKRNFYRSQISKLKRITFSALELIALGDYDKDIILQVIAYEKSRL